MVVGGGGGGSPAPLLSTTTRVGHERKVRREIANSNERKRMQSINAGFQSLRLLLPRTGPVDRLSKVRRTLSTLHTSRDIRQMLLLDWRWLICLQYFDAVGWAAGRASGV